MIMSNKFFAICLCLIGLAAICSQAAELPATPAPAGASGTASAPPSKSADQSTATEGGEEDDEMWLMGDGDYEGEEGLEFEDDYLEDEADSPEEDLADLSEEHYEVKQDCAELADMIEEAKNNGTTADPSLQQAYDDCQQDLKDIESDMKTLSAEIMDDDE